MFPRVLIINGEPFNNRPSAGGVTQNNLFRGWPLERLAMCYTAAQEPSGDICRRYFRLGLWDMVPGTSLFRRSDRERRHQYSTAGTFETVTHDDRLRMRRDTPFRGGLRIFSDMFPYRLSHDFFRWIDEFRPDIIYSFLGNIRLIEVATCLSARFYIPVVPHFMDDWLSTLYSASPLTAIHQRLLGKKMQLLFTRVPVGIGIGPLMAQEYSQRFGIPFESFMNTVPVQSICPAPRNLRADEPIRLTYVGGLHLERWQSLKQIGAALDRIVAEGRHAELLVYAPASDIALYASQLTVHTSLRIMGSIVPEQVSKVLEESDIVVHVESFSKELRRYTRLSVSTKIPQYMAAGRPIMTFAPAEVASTRYISENCCGLVVGTNDNGLLINALRQLIDDPALRNKLGINGWKLARDNHDAAKERERFCHLLSLLTKHTPS